MHADENDSPIGSVGTVLEPLLNWSDPSMLW